MTNDQEPTIARFGNNETRRLSCQEGQYLWWLRPKSMFAKGNLNDWSIVDFWAFKDGDFVTITNRAVDLPGGFELYPTEVSGRNIPLYRSKIESGDYPGEPITANHIWRVMTGGRLVWVHPKARLKRSKVEIISCDECVLVYGENTSCGSLEEYMTFGEPQGERLPPDVVQACRRGFDQAMELGGVNSWDVGGWSIG